MYVVMGATGHVGSAVASTLLAVGEAVTVVTRDKAKAADWRARGAAAAVLDVHDADALRVAFRRARRAFLLNPPAPVSGDTDAEERGTVAAILRALDGSGLEAVVAESTFGAQPGERLGDLSVLYELEQGLARQPIPAIALRAAYYMSNWDALLPAAREGTLPTMLPADLAIPMGAPADCGAAAARLLRAPPAPFAAHPVEGPARYSVTDVAAAFGRALGRDVAPAVTPRDGWIDAFRQQGFSAAAADAYARMTAATVDGAFPLADDTEHGPTTLDSYVTALVARAEGPSPER